MNIKKILLYLALCFDIASAFKNIIIIADVHGDINRFKNILIDANVLNTAGDWIAEPDTAVVQLGDQIDPKPIDNDDISMTHHFEMIYYTDILKTQALDNNCEFISLIGNHEQMNIAKIMKKPKVSKIIASRPIVLKLNKFLFCHGGFKKAHQDILNEYGKTIDDLNTIWYNYVNNMTLSYVDQLILNKLVLDTEDSILYTRLPDNKNDVTNLFNNIGIDFMFVGHTVTKYIHTANRIWYLDQLLRQAFDNDVYMYLIIIENDIIIKHFNYQH